MNPHIPRILLIEDEPPAREQMIRMLNRSGFAPMHVTEAESCAEALRALSEHPAFDLIICDIQLGDGSALGIFQQIAPPCPIVFCTAYDQYVLDALEVGGVDYLLKPVQPTRLERALAKVQQLLGQPRAALDVGALQATLRRLTDKPERRFLVKRGAAFVSVPLGDVAYFASEHKLTLLVQRDGQTSFVDDTLAALDEDLGGFFRANRSLLVRREAVESFRSHTKGRLKLQLSPPAKKDAVVSADNASRFRAWLSGTVWSE